MHKHIIVSFFILLLSSCMIGPNYQRPQVDTPQSWRFEDKQAKDIANTAWWEQFNDPVLTDLIKIALKENKDLLIAASRVEEFIGYYVSTRGSLFPQVDASATAGRQRLTERGISRIPVGGQATFDNYQALINMSWEIDMWGRLRRATEAARADLLSTEEARRALILTLVTSIANAYIDLRNLDRQLDIARSTAKTREESYEIFKLRFEGGVISELELSQVKSEYEDALATIPQIEKNIAQQENALSLLIGRNPGFIPRGKTIDELIMLSVPQGLPSDLLERRPDIRQAEQDMVAANARIGVAKTLYFPNISLTGLFGFSSTELSKLSTGPAKTWNWAVPISAPIFTGGTISGQVHAAEAQQQQALLKYQKAIQTAFREVDDALVDQHKSRDRLAAQARQVDALLNYAQLARLRYENGYTSYLEVLDAERSLFNAEINYTQTQGTLFKALVNLYKAMGGGWVIEADRISNLSPK